ncbi:MAG: hypothetical protein JXA68_05350 [Ignavibacteriales bacterium]|nr:hypothetical protein [Ignavibacteriales bacterium]
MFFKRSKPRNFDYQPRFYKPEEDNEEKEIERRKRKLGFRNFRKKSKISWFSWLLYFLLLSALVYVYLKLTGNL